MVGIEIGDERLVDELPGVAGIFEFQEREVREDQQGGVQLTEKIGGQADPAKVRPGRD